MPGATVADAVAAVEEVLLAGMSAVVHLPDPAARESVRVVHKQTIEALASAHVAEGVGPDGRPG